MPVIKYKRKRDRKNYIPKAYIPRYKLLGMDIPQTPRRWPTRQDVLRRIKELEMEKQ